MCVLVMLAVASAPKTPRYDGVRLFLPVFPFLALLGGKGSLVLVRWVERMGSARLTRWVAAAIGLAIAAEGGWALVSYYPFELSYFNSIVGGLPGAEKRGFETTYWGEALNDDVLTQLNNLPDGSSVCPLAMHAECLLDFNGGN